MKSTKELARELGLLRKRTLSNHGNLPKRSGYKANGQRFSYLVVLDFESTCWENAKFRTQEIIEFPAVLLNTETGQVEDEFQFYVMPQEQPILSQFCTNLTGISQSQVDAGIPISLCLKKFSHWLEKVQSEKGASFPPFGSGDTLATLVTWSDWDLGVCLHYECRRKQLLKPVQLNSWIDLRATYTKFYERKPNGLHGALQNLGIEFEGRQHSGLDDAKNTAKLAWRMIQDGCKLDITKTMKGFEGSPAPALQFPIAPKYGKSKQTFTPPKAKRSKNISPEKTSAGCSSKQNIAAVTKLEEKLTNIQSKELPRSGKPTRIDITSKLTSRDIFCDSHGFSKELDKNSKTATETRLCNELSGNKPFTVGLTAHNRMNSDYKHTNIQEKTVNVGPQKNTPNLSSNGQGSILRFTKCKSAIGPNKTPANPKSSDSFKTPVTSSSMKTMKGTPPMCQCGRRSKRRIVQNPGPNFGRFFFTCGKKQNKCNDENKGCNFFKWEESGKKPSLVNATHNRSFVVERNRTVDQLSKSTSFCGSSVYKPFTPVLTEPLSSVYKAFTPVLTEPISSSSKKKSLGMKSAFLRL